MTDPLENESSILRTFVNHSYWKLHQYALTLLPSSAADLANDLVQEAYLRILMHIRRDSSMLRCLEYCNENPYGPDCVGMMRYMHVTIKRVFINMINRDNSNVISLDEQIELSNDLLSIQDSDEYSSAEKVVIRRELNAEFSSYINMLPKRMQSVMKLKLRGFSSQEIADKLTISPVAVRVTSMRAIRLLHKIISKKHQPPFIQDQKDHRELYKVPPAIINNIMQLPELYRAVIALHDIRHISFSEIANMQKKNIATIKSQYYRGKRKLQILENNASPRNSSELELTETASAHLAHIHKLNGHLREVVELHYIQHLSYAKIAKKLGRSEGTIKGWVNRAMKKLQQYANPQSFPGPVKSPSRRYSVFTVDELEYLKKVPLSYREVIRYYYVESFKVSSIAILLGISEENVKSRIKRGKKFLKDKIDI